MGLTIRARNGMTLARIALAALLLAVAGCSTSDWSSRHRSSLAGPDFSGAPQPAYERGKMHLQAGQLGLALQSFQSAVRQRPDLVAGLNGIAVTYDELGRFDLSRRYYRRALGLGPTSANTLNNFGRSLLRQGEVEAALALLHDAAALAADNEVVKANLELAHRKVAEQGGDKTGTAETVERRPSWIERTSFRLQTLVTALPASAKAVRQRVDRWSAHVAGLEPIEHQVGRDDGAHLPALASKGAKRSTPAAVPVPRLEVSNGAGRRQMAARMRGHLVGNGFHVDRLTNADSFAYAKSVIFFRPGFIERAKQLAALLPDPVRLEEQPDQWSEVRLRLGGDLLDFDLTLLES